METSKDLSSQWDFHSAFRDRTKNMYRTTYTDMVHFREVTTKSELPSGYGGHIPSVAHDSVFKNTELAKTLKERSLDPSRDTLPSFAQQIDGVATNAKYQAEETPTYGALPNVRLLPPWAITPPIHTVPNFRTVPPNIKKE